MNFFLGIDAGTSGIKAIVLDETGTVYGSGYYECDIISPQPGWVEQNAEDWWDACSKAIRKAVTTSGHAKDISAISLSGQMQGCLPLGADLKPVRNCIIWLDQRATRQTDAIRALVGDKFSLQTTGNYCLNSFWAPKLLWIRENEPEVFDSIRHVLFAKDYLRLKLTGELATEVSDASCSFLLDINKRAWSGEMIEKLGIPADIVPKRLVESCEIVGQLRGELAQEWGMRSNVAVVAGGGDQPMAGIGLGIVEEGRIGATIGTSGVVFGCADKPFIDKQDRATLSLVHAVPDKWCYLGLVLSAGASFKWLRDTVFQDKKLAMAQAGEDVYNYMTGLAAQAPIGSEGLLYLPYLNGEKTPINNPNARGVFFGLSVRHGLNELCRSIMEGITFSMRDSIELCREFVPVHEVCANGGGAKSALWRQMQADIYNANVLTLNADEGGVAGAAILAGYGTGYFSSIKEGCDSMLRVTGVTEPVAEHVKRYDEYYREVKQLYASVKDNFSSLARLVGQK